MVSVKGGALATGPGTPITSLTDLGLAADPIVVTVDVRHTDLIVDAWGPSVPVDVQFFLAVATIKMTLIHFDRDVLDTCISQSLAQGNLAGAGPAVSVGMLERAGMRLGAGAARLTAGWKFIGLNIRSPGMAKPWRFLHTYLTGPSLEYPLGTQRSACVLTWRAIPYTNDPWGGGTGARGASLWDHVLDA